MLRTLIIDSFNSDPNFLQERLVNDYELDYNIEGNRKITINGNSVTIGNGSFLFRKPGGYYSSIGVYHDSDCIKIYDQLTYNVQKADSKNANTTQIQNKKIKQE